MFENLFGSMMGSKMQSGNMMGGGSPGDILSSNGGGMGGMGGGGDQFPLSLLTTWSQPETWGLLGGLGASIAPPGSSSERLGLFVMQRAAAEEKKRERQRKEMMSAMTGGKMGQGGEDEGGSKGTTQGQGPFAMSSPAGAGLPPLDMFNAQLMAAYGGGMV